MAGIRGHTSKGRRRGKRTKRREEREREGPDPLSQIPESAPIIYPSHRRVFTP